MKRLGFLKLAEGAPAVLVLAALLALPSCVSEKTVGRPNFVFILVDDMGWRDAGCYGSTFYETPNLDRLAREGMLFTDGYATSPVCSPTRGAILTGKYPARTGLTDWIGPPERHPVNKVIPPPNVEQLPLQEFTLGEAFKEAGYTTFYAGKWHLGKEPFYPNYQGFDSTVAVADTLPYFPPSGDRSAEAAGGSEGEYLTDRLTDESLKFLDEQVGKEKPFLLYLSHYAVHAPFKAKKNLIAKYENKAKLLPPVEHRFLAEGDSQARQTQNDPVMAAMIESMDDSVGRVMNKLQDLGVAEDTVVIFTSDNGGMGLSFPSRPLEAPTSNLPLRAGKGHLYEGGIRVPLIIKWPAVVKVGSLSSQPVISTDFYPTMLDIAALPLKPEQHVDGRSLLPVLKGTDLLKRDALFWHYPHYDRLGDRPASAVRFGNYKLIEFLEDGRLELYDLNQDLGERHNLTAKMPAKATQLRALLYDWRTSVNARMPTPNPDHIPGSIPGADVQ